MTNFEPTEVWQPDTTSFELEPAIEKAKRELNSKPPIQLIENLKERVEVSDNGVVFAVLKGENPAEYSDTDALVVFNPFANTATPNMLVRSEFLRLVAKNSDITDQDGKLKPIIMLAAPGLHGSKLKLDSEEKHQIKKGDLGPAAKELLKTVTRQEYGRVALLGFSQGADMALAGANIADAANLDAREVSVGDPAGVKDRGLVKLLKDFGAASPDLEHEARESGLEALDRARHMEGEYRRFAVSALYPTNWMVIARALGRDSFEQQVEQALSDESIERIVVGYGANSTISPPEAIEPSLARLHEQAGHNELVSIRVEGKGHAWGDNLNLLAKLYLRALV